MSLLLQVMDNATLTDNNGVKSDFQNVILIMTSNLGATADNVMGFAKNSLSNEDKAIKRFFSPEFRNRLSATVRFEKLNQEVVVKIVAKFIKDLEESLVDKDIKITISIKAKKELVKRGYDKIMGARPLQRIIYKEIKEPLADEILFGDLKDGGSVKIDFTKDKFVFKVNGKIDKKENVEIEMRNNE
jgi:ATP-dependent Clp protease ATP-binding subunit ClpA